MTLPDSAGPLALLCLIAGPLILLAYAVPACRRAHTPRRAILLAAGGAAMPMVFVACAAIARESISPGESSVLEASAWARTGAVLGTSVIAAIVFTIILRGGAAVWMAGAALAATGAALPWPGYTNGDPIDPLIQALLWPQIAWHVVAAIGMARWATHHRAAVRRDQGRCPICNRRRDDLAEEQDCPRCGASARPAGPPAARL